MHKPFAILEGLVREGRITLAAGIAIQPQPDTVLPQFPDDLSDSDLFDYAMKDVKALGWSAGPLHHRAPLEIRPQNDEEEALRALEEFLQNGDVEIEQTAEYIEGSVRPEGRLYLRDLRAGHFSVQAYLDLHGMNQQEARFALGEFIVAAARGRLSCVRVIHGRGRHSHKHEPILKGLLQRWLCSRRISRHVIAYTSARMCDGGGGALYILLRN